MSKKTNTELTAEEISKKIDSGEWQTFDVHFAAQFSTIAFSEVVLVVAAPDYEAALKQFNIIINRDYKQLVAVVKPGTNKKDIAFLNLSKAEAIILTSPEEEKEEDCKCKDGECKCQTSDKKKKK